MTADPCGPVGNPDRLAALRRTALLDSQAEEAFDRLTRLAAKVIGAPVALVSLIDEDRQVFKSCVGLPEPWASRRATPLSLSICQYAVGTGEPLVIEDTREHPLLRAHGAIPALGVAAYAGVPLVTSEGHALGTFCVIDTRRRAWTADEIETLRDLAASVMTEIELRAAIRAAVRQEEAAERERSEKAAILRAATEGVYGVDSGGRCTFIDRAGAEMLGYRAEDLVGRELHDVIHGRRADGSPYPAAECPILAALRTGRAVRLDDELLWRRDGTALPVEYGCYPIVEHGLRQGAIVTFTDITERKRTERLAAEQERLAALRAEVGLALAGSGDLRGVLQACAEALVRRLDAALVRIWTLNSEEQVLELQASAGLYTHLDGAHARVPVGGFKIGLIARERRPHLTNAVIGDPRVHDQAWAEREGLVAFAGYPLLSEDRVVGVVALFARRRLEDFILRAIGSLADHIALSIDLKWAAEERDRLLAREQATRQAAEAAEVRYRGLFEGVADAILVADAEGRYRDANPAATRLLGYAREELLRLRVADVVAAGPAWTAVEYDRFVREGTWHGELELRRKDGAPVPVEAWATTIRLPDGPVYVSAVRDVSERRALERLQREFIAMVTHDLGNPIAVIRGAAQLMQQRGPTASMIELIAAAAGRLQRLVGDLLDVARLDTGQFELRRSSADLAAVARAAAEQAAASSREHAVVTEVPRGMRRGWWDPDRLGQVLQNLLANAIKYSPSGGEVRVRVEDLGQEARVSVADRGIGIAPDALPQLFGRFYRTEAAAASGATGLGLGLFIAKSLVEAHGGRIWAESAGEGCGTIVRFTLPYELTGGTKQPPG